MFLLPQWQVCRNDAVGSGQRWQARCGLSGALGLQVVVWRWQSFCSLMLSCICFAWCELCTAGVSNYEEYSLIHEEDEGDEEKKKLAVSLIVLPAEI